MYNTEPEEQPNLFPDLASNPNLLDVPQNDWLLNNWNYDITGDVFM
jgi:hypothetical protein